MENYEREYVRGGKNDRREYVRGVKNERREYVQEEFVRDSQLIDITFFWIPAIVYNIYFCF